MSEVCTAHLRCVWVLALLCALISGTQGRSYGSGPHRPVTVCIVLVLTECLYSAVHQPIKNQ